MYLDFTRLVKSFVVGAFPGSGMDTAAHIGGVPETTQ
jgi:hypothetical protein